MKWQLKLHVNKQSRRHQEWTILGTRHRTRDIKNKQYWAQDTEQGTSRMDNTGNNTQNNPFLMSLVLCLVPSIVHSWCPLFCVLCPVLSILDEEHQEWTKLSTRHRTRDIKNGQYWAQDTERGTSRMDNTEHKTQNKGHQEWTILGTRHRTKTNKTKKKQHRKLKRWALKKQEWTQM
jgi:hypothetical protein